MPPEPGSTCHSCGGARPDEARFCIHCGAAIARTCRSCRTPLPDDARFCPACGVRQEGARSSPPPSSPAAGVPPTVVATAPGSAGARKHITALFADIAGSTELLSDLDPEDARHVLDRIMSALVDAVTESGGVVAKVMGDGLFAVFGAPLAQESHAVRACFAAMQMQRLAARMDPIAGRRVELRIGLNSGTAVTTRSGEGADARVDAFGDVVNRAAHLEAQARPGRVLISAATHRLAGTAVEARRLSAGNRPASGPDAFELVNCGRWQNILAVSAEDARVAFVGRGRESAFVHAAIAALGEGKGDAIAIEGDAGIGKTRFLAETLARYTAEEITKIGAAGSVTQRTTPDAVLRQIVSTVLGRGNDGPETAVGERLADVFPDLAHAAQPLQWLLSGDAAEIRPEDTETLRRRALGAAKALLAQSAQARPLVLVVDDYQWVDDSSREFVRALDKLVEQSPILVLIATRDAAHAPARQLLRLSSLSTAEARDLLASCIGERPGTAALRDEILARAQNNPRFLVEIVRSLSEAGALTGEPGEMELSDRAEIGAIPASVTDLFEERTDRLPPRERRLLQLLAAYGESIDIATAAALSGEEAGSVAAGLQALSDAGLVREASFLPETSFAVASPLVAEAASRSLLREDRRQLHGSICDYLLAAPDAPEKYRALGRHAQLCARFDLAAEAGFLAGRDACARLAYGESAELLRLALQANDQRDDRHDGKDALAVDIRLALRDALFPRAAFEEIGRLLEEALAAAETLGDDARHRTVRRHLIGNLLATGRLEDALPLAEALAAETTAAGEAAEASFLLVQILASHGQYAEAERTALRLTAASTQSGEPAGAEVSVPAALARMWAIWCAAEQGRFEQAIGLVQECQSVLTSAQPPFFRILAGIGTGLFWLRYGEMPLAADTFRKVLPLTEFDATQPWFPSVASPLGLALVRLGHAGEALPLLRAAVDRTPYRGGVGRSLRMVHLAECLLALGRTAEAHRIAGDALNLSERTLEMGARAYALRTVAECWRATGRHGRASTTLAAARKLADELGMAPLRDEIDRSAAPADDGGDFAGPSRQG